jgi:hypothetical protein
MPGGATLRWSMPRYFDNTVLVNSASPLPEWRYAAALTLYIASFDVMLQTGDQQQVSWPGVVPGAVASDYKVAVANRPAESRWVGQLAASAVEKFGGSGSLGPLLARTAAVPALDLLAYARPGGVVEADLVTLGGGARYVLAWLGYSWARWETVDWMAALSGTYQVPWSVAPGRAYRACHDEVWSVGFPTGVDATLGGAPASEVEMFTSPFATRRGVYSPIRGLWSVSYCVNATGAPANVWFGLEQRATDVLGRTSVAQTNATHNVLAPARVHGGAAALAFWSSAVPSAGGIVGVQVVKT